LIREGRPEKVRQIEQNLHRKGRGIANAIGMECVFRAAEKDLRRSKKNKVHGHGTISWGINSEGHQECRQEAPGKVYSMRRAKASSTGRGIIVELKEEFKRDPAEAKQPKKISSSSKK